MSLNEALKLEEAKAAARLTLKQVTRVRVGTFPTSAKRRRDG